MYAENTGQVRASTLPTSLFLLCTVPLSPVFELSLGQEIDHCDLLSSYQNFAPWTVLTQNIIQLWQHSDILPLPMPQTVAAMSNILVLLQSLLGAFIHFCC